MGITLLAIVLSASAEGAAPTCPFEVGGPDTEQPVELMGGRVAALFNTGGMETRGEPEPDAADPLAPLGEWKDFASWPGALALVEDPLLLAPEDLQPEAERYLRQRTRRSPLTTAPAPVPLALIEDGVNGAFLSGKQEDGYWIMAGVLALPTNEMIQVSLSLSPRFADDVYCQDAARERVFTLGQGTHPASSPGETALDLRARKSALVLQVPEGYAPMVMVGAENEQVRLLERVPAAQRDRRGSVTVDFSHTPEEVPPRMKDRGDRIHRAEVLGRKVAWTASADTEGAIETYVPSFMGTEQKGVIHIEVNASTPEEREALRVIVEQMRIDQDSASD